MSTAADAPLSSLSLTHVFYNASDPISYLCAWLALVPQGLCVIYVTLIWSTREAEILLMFAGQMGCELLNFLLKRLIKEDRPKQMLGKGYGMPSSHAQFACFFSIYLSLFLLLRHKPPSQPNISYISPDRHLLFIERLGLSILALICALCVAFSRMYLNYHTGRQIAVGCTAGAGSAVLWFLIVKYLRHSGWLDWALKTDLAQLFRLRDLVIEEDLVTAGWLRWKEKSSRSQVSKSQKVKK